MATYDIYTLAQLQAITPTHLADDCVLHNDIDASDTRTMNATGIAGEYYGFEPIGTNAAPFTGTFDGGGFTIRNLYINRAATSYVGLFGRILKATGNVHDLSIVDAEITGLTNVGILVGLLNGTAGNLHAVTDCIATGTISANGQDIGGMAGETTYGNYTDCSSSVEITQVNTLYNVGGFVGGIATGSTFTRCTSAGSIDISGTGSSGGGIGGFTSGGTASTFTNCSATTSIVNSATLAAGTVTCGGFVGGLSVTNIFTYCASYGSIVSSANVTQSHVVGGFCGNVATVGQAFTECTASCSVDVTIAPVAFAGGFFGVVGGAASITIDDCRAMGDVCKLGTPPTTYTGGFAGNIGASVSIQTCYSIGYVYKTTNSGGFAGASSVTNATCFWDTETSGMSTSAGTTPATGKTTAEIKTQATFTPTGTADGQWNFTNTWFMDSATQSAVLGSNITLWASRTNDYDNFQMGDKDDDAIENEIPTQNEIRFVAALEALIIGTAGDEWKMGSNKLSTPITPTNITIKQQSEYGSSLIQPVKINSAILFVDIVARKLREAAYDSNSEKFLSPDLTELAEHITKTGITTIARQKNPDSILWCTLTDGTLLSFTYERDQNVLAWAKHPLGGNGFCQSVCVLPGATEDVVYISVYRTRVGSAVTRDGETITRDGETVYWGESENVFIEKIMPRTFDTISDCFFVDSGITATRATATSIVTGLDHLEGETVKLLVDGVEADEDVVENGQVTVSFAGVASTTWTTAHVGLAYTSLLQPLRIVVGDSHGAITKVPELNASFLDTGAASYGNDDSDVKAIDFTQIGLINTSDITGLYTGQTKLTMPGGFSTENPIYISSDKPLPCTVRALMCRIEKTGR